MSIFDYMSTAGQERYHSFAPMYYRGAQAAVIVYDITSYDSFSRAQKWVKELQRQGSPNMVVALIGNKVDLASKRAVEIEESKAYAEENGLMLMETSAKTGANVNELFVSIAKRLPKAAPRIHESGATPAKVRLESDTTPKSGGGCCGGGSNNN